MPNSIAEDMMEAFKEVEAKEDDTSVVAEQPQTEAPAAQSAEPVAATAPAAPVVGAVSEEPAAAPSEQQGGWTQDKAPQSWTPEAREKWATIPEDLRKEIVRREEAAVNGVRQLQEKYAPHEQFVSALAPFIQEGLQAGVAPDAYIRGVLQSERVLRTADVPGKFQALLGIADQYGIPLRDIINESVGQKVLGAPAQQQAVVPPQVSQELAEMRQWRAKQESQAMGQQVEQFSAGKEFFNDVRVAMADLMDAGQAATLEEAYDRACWMVPSVRTVMLQRQQQTGAINQRQQRAAGISPSSGGSVPVAEDFGNEDDVAETIRKSVQLHSGRV